MEQATFTSYKLNAAELQEKCAFLKNEKGCGFVRMSDSETPLVISGGSFPDIGNNVTSFLFEALFYVEGKYSISIRQFNDFWLFNQVDWHILPPEKSTAVDEFQIFTRYMFDGTPMRFITWYTPVECCHFETLRPAWTAFTGFLKGE
ncbi:MAG: hypothetical protein IKD44_02335 [Lentisphaeria bacterium]|nr:hypothetical protein [Lentisphaeria bacterium]